MNLEKYLLLDVKKLLIIVFLFIGVVILHNLVFALFAFEEALFFIIAGIIIAYFIIAVGYTIFHHVKRRIKK